MIFGGSGDGCVWKIIYRIVWIVILLVTWACARDRGSVTERGSSLEDHFVRRVRDGRTKVGRVVEWKCLSDSDNKQVA